MATWDALSERWIEDWNPEAAWQSLSSPDFKLSIPGAFDIDTGYQSPDASLYGGDPRTDPRAMYRFLINNGLAFDLQSLLSRGMPAEFANAVQQEAAAQKEAQGQESGGFFSGMLSSGVDFAKEVAPLVAAAGATYFGAQGLGAMLPSAGGAASGAELAGAYGGMDAGAIAAASESGALIPPAAGGMGGGALGGSMTTPISATSPWTTQAPAAAAGAGAGTGILPAIGSAVGIASGLKSLFGGDDGGGYAGGTGTNLPIYVPTGQAAADVNWQQLQESLSRGVGRNVAMTDPNLVAAYQQLMGMDRQPLVAAGQQAGAQYGDLASRAQMYSRILGDQAGMQFGAGRDVYNLGRDPQRELHDFLAQQQTDQSRAASSARGLAMSPYSAGLETDALRKFEMDWQNEQLRRSIGGLDAMNRSAQMGGAALSGSMGFGEQAPIYTSRGAQVPFQAQQAAYQLPIDWANMYTASQNANVIGPQQALQSGILPYLDRGTNAGAYAAQSGLAGAQFQNQMQTQGFERILGGMQGLGDIMNEPGSWLSNMGTWGNPSGPAYTGYGAAGDYQYG